MGIVKFGLDNFVQGGLIQDVDVTFSNSRFEWFDYQGKADQIVAFASDLVKEDGETVTQHWPIGGKDTDLKPTEDGRSIESPTDVTLKRGSNFHTFLMEAGNHGIDVKNGVADAGIFNGLKAHIIRIPVKGGGQNSKDREVLVISKVIQMPTGKGKPATAAAKNGTVSTSAPAASAASDASDDDVQAAAVETLNALTEALKEGDKLTTAKLKLNATTHLLKSPHKAIRTQIINKLIDTAWLEESGADLGLVLDGTNLVKAA